MEYRGRIKNGVVVLEGAPDLAEDTVVRVELIAEAEPRPRPGSREAILACRARWQGESAEADRILDELRESKWAEVRERQARGEA